MSGFKSIVLGALLVTTPVLAWSTTTTNYSESNKERAVGSYDTHDAEQDDERSRNSLELNMNSKSYDDANANISRKTTGTTSLGSDFSTPSQQQSSYNLKESHHSDNHGPSGVPIPGAVWLMGSAILGLFSFGKRKKTSAS
ncbi:MAG: hypothetical protein NTV00_16515 [Methylococcales bacterium]|nr:hypothetical protein [Methylococcales bacterium]